MKLCGTPGLELTDQISCYCERAGNPDFWAEPINALSNAAFLFAAYFGWRFLKSTGLERRKSAIIVLICLTALVGTGSFLFHTFATVWASLTDIVPIGALILFYLILAVHWYLRMSIPAAVLIAVGVVFVMFSLPPLLNGSLLYVPPIVTVNLIGIYLVWRKTPGAWMALSGALIFLPSIIFRSIDRLPQICSETVLGTHFLWHGLNALGIYLLIRALILYCRNQEVTQNMNSQITSEEPI